jgi:hypothetical protein
LFAQFFSSKASSVEETSADLVDEFVALRAFDDVGGVVREEAEESAAAAAADAEDDVGGEADQDDEDAASAAAASAAADALRSAALGCIAGGDGEDGDRDGVGRDTGKLYAASRSTSLSRSGSDYSGDDETEEDGAGYEEDGATVQPVLPGAKCRINCGGAWVTGTVREVDDDLAYVDLDSGGEDCVEIGTPDFELLPAAGALAVSAGLARASAVAKASGEAEASGVQRRSSAERSLSFDRISSYERLTMSPTAVTQSPLSKELPLRSSAPPPLPELSLTSAQSAPPLSSGDEGAAARAHRAPRGAHDGAASRTAHRDVFGAPFAAEGESGSSDGGERVIVHRANGGARSFAPVVDFELKGKRRAVRAGEALRVVVPVPRTPGGRGPASLRWTFDSSADVEFSITFAPAFDARSGEDRKGGWKPLINELVAVRPGFGGRGARGGAADDEEGFVREVCAPRIAGGAVEYVWVDFESTSLAPEDAAARATWRRLRCEWLRPAELEIVAPAALGSAAATAAQLPTSRRGGTATVVFDNSASWWSHRVVSYTIAVLVPADGTGERVGSARLAQRGAAR